MVLSRSAGHRREEEEAILQRQMRDLEREPPPEIEQVEPWPNDSAVSIHEKGISGGCDGID